MSPLNPYRLDPERREKINLNFYFRTSLWCHKRFYEGLKGLHRTFWDITKRSVGRIKIFLFLSRKRFPLVTHVLKSIHKIFLPIGSVRMPVCTWEAGGFGNNFSIMIGRGLRILSNWWSSLAFKLNCNWVWEVGKIFGVECTWNGDCWIWIWVISAICTEESRALFS